MSASAIGIYDYADTSLEIDENAHQASGFIGDLCRDWELAADKFKLDGVANHVSKIRVSLVMGEEFAFFQSFKSAASADNLNHIQTSYLPWNHVTDMAGIFAFALEHQLDGVYNSVAPVAATAADVVKAISNIMYHTDHSILPYRGQRLVAHAIQEAGYQFKYPDIQSAVNTILS